VLNPWGKSVLLWGRPEVDGDKVPGIDEPDPVVFKMERT
jgi:hypothetical protein